MQYSERLISKSYKGEISSELIIRDCVNHMGLPFGRMDGFDFSNIRDYVARGRCVDVIGYSNVIEATHVFGNC